MNSNIYCGQNAMEDVVNALDFCSFKVTDSNIAKLYPELTAGAYVIPAGEKSKSPEMLFNILAKMQESNVKRGDRIASIGGGVVSDITGLAASLYMRGVEWTNIPTSLMAMVDAGIGGKTAIDFCGIKNLVGTYHKPVQIVINTDFLSTLPEREWVCGAGELIKTCLLSEDAYRELYDKLGGFRAKKPDYVYALISRCVEIKNAVVVADPKEQNLRKILNVGHTVGHALESADNYKLSHGEYVLKGMMTEAAMCKDIIEPKFYRQLLEMTRCFTSAPRTTANVVLEKATHDKKNVGSTITLMVPASYANVMEVRMETKDFIERYNQAIKELR
ncbi:MAG: 3-dehydroquinate synthase [Clostridiales bacterium]|nr:3-dehydroquinate synthase [Clostridiales bacterium]